MPPDYTCKNRLCVLKLNFMILRITLEYIISHWSLILEILKWVTVLCSLIVLLDTWLFMFQVEHGHV